MLLLIDAGNTRIKWALAAPGAALGAWRANGAVVHEDAGQLAAAWSALPAPAHIVLANVAGDAVRGRLLALLDGVWPGVAPTLFAAQAELAGVRNGYRVPGKLGCDRFAAAIGAHALFPGRALVVAGCGTATTVDSVSADGVFEGGMILPGLFLMARALAGHTAQLPQIDWADALAAGTVADHTEAAIAAGCLAAQCGAIDRALAAQRLRHGDALCVLSGGAAPAVARALGTPCEIIDNLALIGLHAAFGI
jgi:type III pantothenate kinase